MSRYTSNPFPTPKLVNEPPRATYSKMWSALKNERDMWMPAWEECADFVLPFIGMRYEGNSANSDRRPRKSRRTPVIINNKAGMAARVLINGLAGGLTSPSRPWIRLGVPKNTEPTDGEGARWFWGASQAILWLASTSNYYSATKLQYRDLVVYGPGLKIIDEHPRHNMNATSVPIGSYCLMLGEDYRPNGFAREVIYTVGQLVERFGYERVSKRIRNSYDKGDYYHEHLVCHVVEPNRMYQGSKFGPTRYKIASVWYERDCGDDHKDLLSYKGYENQPFSAPRWDYLPGDTYGPGVTLETLGDIKALQVLEHRKAQAIDKQVTPPTQGPASLQKGRVGPMPGSHTTVAEVNGKITSLYDVRPDMQALSLEIREHERRIDEAYHVDVLRSATDLTRQNVKAEEIVERREEKMIAFSPILENLYTEMLDVDVQRMLYIGRNIGLIPPPPPSLRNRQFSIEYISTLAQAQKAASITSIERVFTFAGSVAGVYPEAKDKLDVDASIDEYAEAVGAPASILVPADGVAQLRKMRQQQAEQQAALQQTAVGVEAAKNLSEAKMTDPSMLSYLIGGGQ